MVCFSFNGRMLMGCFGRRRGASHQLITDSDFAVVIVYRFGAGRQTDTTKDDTDSKRNPPAAISIFSSTLSSKSLLYPLTDRK